MAGNIIPFPQSSRGGSTQINDLTEALSTLEMLVAKLASAQVGSREWHIERIKFGWWSAELLRLQHAQGGLVA